MTTAAPSLARLVWLIGIGQILSWGSLTYTITVLGRAMAADLGVAPAVAYGAFSVGLVASGLAAPYSGQWIDSRGGRSGLTLGSVLAGGALALLAASPNVYVFYAGWMLAGVAMAFTLYDPAFAALARVVPNDLRRAVTLVTLLGGFASTVFWPLTQWLLDDYGWRVTLGVYALAHFVIGIPIHQWALAGESHHAAPVAAASAAHSAATPSTRAGFVPLGCAFAFAAFITAAMGAHVISLLTVDGMVAESAVWIAALIGPMQVLGRVIEFSVAGRVAARTIGRISFGLMVLSLAILSGIGSSFAAALVFVVFYGWANGTMTIVRGTLPAELFGRAGYGALLGSLSRPAQITRAVGPFATALVLFDWMPGATKVGLVVIALCGYVAYEIALWRVRRARR